MQQHRRIGAHFQRLRAHVVAARLRVARARAGEQHCCYGNRKQHGGCFGALRSLGHLRPARPAHSSRRPKRRGSCAVIRAHHESISVAPRPSRRRPVRGPRSCRSSACARMYCCSVFAQVQPHRHPSLVNRGVELFRLLCCHRSRAVNPRENAIVAQQRRRLHVGHEPNSIRAAARGAAAGDEAARQLGPAAAAVLVCKLAAGDCVWG